MASLWWVEASQAWRVRAGLNIAEFYTKDFEKAKAVAEEWDKAWPGHPLKKNGKRRTRKEKDRICQAIHEYNEEHGMGGIPLFSREYDITTRTLERWLRDWRKRQGIVTRGMKAREKSLARS